MYLHHFFSYIPSHYLHLDRANEAASSNLSLRAFLNGGDFQLSSPGQTDDSALLWTHTHTHICIYVYVCINVSIYVYIYSWSNVYNMLMLMLMLMLGVCGHFSLFIFNFTVLHFDWHFKLKEPWVLFYRQSLFFSLGLLKRSICEKLWDEMQLLDQ